MAVPTLELARKVGRLRPPVWPLRFHVTRLQVQRGRAHPSEFVERAVLPEGSAARAAASRLGTLIMIGARADQETMLTVVGRDRRESLLRFASIDEAEAHAAGLVLEQLGRYRPRLLWRRSAEKGFTVEAEVDLPIWGHGKLLVPERDDDGDFGTGGQWHGLEPWGQPFRSSLPATRQGLQAFVDDWLALMDRGVRYYRVFPYVLGEDEKFPPGAARQLRTAQLIEAGVKLHRGKKAYEKMSERERAISQSTWRPLDPVFNWDFKATGGARGGRWRPVVADDHPSKGSAQHEGFFNVGQAAGAYEIVEYTTGPKPTVKSLGVWKPPTLEAWRRSKRGELEAKKIELPHAARGTGYGQLELGTG